MGRSSSTVSIVTVLPFLADIVVMGFVFEQMGIKIEEEEEQR